MAGMFTLRIIRLPPVTKLFATVLFTLLFLFFTGLGYVEFFRARNKDPWWMPPVYIGLLYLGPCQVLECNGKIRSLYAMGIFYGPVLCLS